MNRFDSVKHLYYLGDRVLKSVTTLINEYTPEFNAPKVASMIAGKGKYAGRKSDDILNEWDLKRDIANNYGTSVHAAVELWIKYGLKPTQPHLLLVVDKFIEKFGIINWESEYRLFNEEYELGGTIDLVSFDSKIIADIKTNDTFKEEKKEKFKSPLSHLKVSNLNKVRIQTKVYQELLSGEYKRYVYNWNGYDFEVTELEDVDVSLLLAKRKAEVEFNKL